MIKRLAGEPQPQKLESGKVEKCGNLLHAIILTSVAAEWLKNRVLPFRHIHIFGKTAATTYIIYYII